MTPFQPAMFQKILIPLDGSTVAEAALAPAQELAGLNNAEIILVRAIPLPACLSEVECLILDTSEMRVAEFEACQGYLKQQAAELRAQGRKVAYHAIQMVPPLDALLQAVRQSQADLVIMTSHGRGGAMRMLLGSVAEGLTRNAACPVMIVGPNAVQSTAPAAVHSLQRWLTPNPRLAGRPAAQID